jgi:hypothetical protein
LFVALIGALGLVLAGGAIGRGFRDARMAERYVSVKGVSEREVKADLALWPIPFVAANDDLALAQEQIVRSSEQIKSFLVRQGLDTAQAQLQTLRVTDRQANPYQTQEGGRRFIIRQTLIVRSTDPDRVLAASQRVGELVQGGVVLSSGEEYGPGGPTFLFTKLNDIKPAMIAEATSRARDPQWGQGRGWRVRGHGLPTRSAARPDGFAARRSAPPHRRGGRAPPGRRPERRRGGRRRGQGRARAGEGVPRGDGGVAGGR